MSVSTHEHHAYKIHSGDLRSRLYIGKSSLCLSDVCDFEYPHSTMEQTILHHDDEQSDTVHFFMFDPVVSFSATTYQYSDKITATLLAPSSADFKPIMDSYFDRISFLPDDIDAKKASCYESETLTMMGPMNAKAKRLATSRDEPIDKILGVFLYERFLAHTNVDKTENRNKALEKFGLPPAKPFS